MSDADIQVIDRGIRRFVVDQLKIFKMGLGWFNEQGGESVHKLIKEMASSSSSSIVSSSAITVEPECKRPRPLTYLLSDDEAEGENDSNLADPDYECNSRYVKKKTNVVTMEACGSADRKLLSVRSQSESDNCTLNAVGLPENKVSHVTVMRRKNAYRKEAFEEQLNFIGDATHIELGFDGKSVLNRERYVSNVIVPKDNSERLDLLLDIKIFPGSAKAKDIFEHIKQFDRNMILKKVMIIVADTTSLNTG